MDFLSAKDPSFANKRLISCKQSIHTFHKRSFAFAKKASLFQKNALFKSSFIPHCPKATTDLLKDKRYKKAMITIQHERKPDKLTSFRKLIEINVVHLDLPKIKILAFFLNSTDKSRKENILKQNICHFDNLTKR